MKIRKMKNLQSLLCNNMEQLQNNPNYIPQAQAMSNASGKLMSAIRLELQYNLIRGKAQKKVEFM